MMTEQEEDCSMRVIDFCRRHFRQLGAEQFAAKLGARPDDISIAAIYAAVDLAQHHTGDTASAISWARQALDVLEGKLEVTVQ
jgi:hypothetical protein